MTRVPRPCPASTTVCYACLVLGLVSLSTAATLADPAPAVEPRVILWREAVDTGVRLARAYLYNAQSDGAWSAADGPADERGVATAVATLGLLWSGEYQQKAEVVAAVDALLRMRTDSTTARALRVEIIRYLWANSRQAPPGAYEQAQADAAAVLNSVALERDGPWVHAAWAEDGEHFRDGAGAGARTAAAVGVAEAAAEPALSADASAAAVAMLAASRFELPPAYWPGLDKAWRAYQARDGSFEPLARLVGRGRPPGRPDVARATAQGLLVLLEAARMLDEDKRARTAGNPDRGATDAAVAYLGRSFDDLLAGDRAYESAHWAARALHAAGVRWAGTTDWAGRIVRFLIQAQRADGSWGNGPRDTGYALMALRFCKAPVAVQKLKYAVRGPGGLAEEGHWNQRPADVANWVRKAGRHYCCDDLTAITVSLNADADRWLTDVPMLYVSGDQALTFTNVERAQLKRYVEAGGQIVGNADGGSAAFADSFRQLGREMFPDYPMAPLTPERAVGARMERAAAQAKPLGVESVSNGARDLMLLIVGDAGLYWQKGQPATARGRAADDLGLALVWNVWDRERRRENMFEDSAPIEAPAQQSPVKREAD